jgi:hypothetical protein
MKRASLICLLALVAAPALAIAADGGPAVSDPNGKLSVEGGQYDGDQSVLTLGSYTVPLGHSFGLQADGALGRIDEDTMAGGGLHLFTRDPSSYLLGLYGSYHAWNSVDIWRAATEFQLYVRQFSLDGLAGFESVNVPTTAGSPVVGTSDNLAFGQIDLAYYPIDYLKLTIGYHYEDATSLGSVGVEYLRQRFADFSVRQERFRRRAVQPRNGRPQDVFRQRSRQIAHRAPPHRGSRELNAEVSRAQDRLKPVHGQLLVQRRVSHEWPMHLSARHFPSRQSAKLL